MSVESIFTSLTDVSTGPSVVINFDRQPSSQTDSGQGEVCSNSLTRLSYVLFSVCQQTTQKVASLDLKEYRLAKLHPNNKKESKAIVGVA